MPALIAKGTCPADWEASLDGASWQTVESDSAYDEPARAPDVWRPQYVDIPSHGRTAVSPTEWIEDFRYVRLGIVSFAASGRGVLWNGGAPDTNYYEFNDRLYIDAFYHITANFKLGLEYGRLSTDWDKDGTGYSDRIQFSAFYDF